MYSAFDRELLACFQAMRHFRFMLDGRRLTLFTDHTRRGLGCGMAQGAAWLGCGMARVQRGLDSSAPACCTAGPSSNLGSAPQRRPSTERKP
jgi:hypothetical protein